METLLVEVVLGVSTVASLVLFVATELVDRFGRFLEAVERLRRRRGDESGVEDE